MNFTSEYFMLVSIFGNLSSFLSFIAAIAVNARLLVLVADEH